MERLFTYTIPFDDGAAPNPFHGMCSLAICKPAIRRVAKAGDWVAGLGSKYAPSGDLSKRLVYAMRVEEVLSLEMYDRYALNRWPHRIPNIQSSILQDRLGDCIYDFSKAETPIQRNSVHGQENIDTDLRGQNVLISKDFYYFGRNAVALPEHLQNICHNTQGHRSNANTPHFQDFVRWIRDHFPTSGQLGWPGHIIDWEQNTSCRNCTPRKLDGELDAEFWQPGSNTLKRSHAL